MRFAFGWLVAAAGVSASLGAAMVCYHAFERPLLDVKERLHLGRAASDWRWVWTQPAACLGAVCAILAVAGHIGK